MVSIEITSLCVSASEAADEGANSQYPIQLMSLNSLHLQLDGIGSYATTTPITGGTAYPGAANVNGTFEMKAKSLVLSFHPI